MDYAIITLIFASKLSLDMELPLKIKISELTVLILTTLKQMDYGRFARLNSIKLQYNEKQLDPNATLEQYGVWDGSYLTVIEN